MLPFNFSVSSIINFASIAAVLWDAIARIFYS